MAGERTEQATQHRRDKARREGDILHSRELAAAAGTLAGVMVLGAIGPRLLMLFRSSFAAFLDLGRAVCWEPTELHPTLLAMRRLTFALLGGPAVMLPDLAANTGLSVPAVITGRDYKIHVQAPEFQLHHTYVFDDASFEVTIICDGLQ